MNIKPNPNWDLGIPLFRKAEPVLFHCVVQVRDLKMEKECALIDAEQPEGELQWSVSLGPTTSLPKYSTHFDENSPSMNSTFLRQIFFLLEYTET